MSTHDATSDERHTSGTSLDSPLPSRRTLVTAAGASALAAGLTAASTAPATALSPAAAPSIAPAATPPGVGSEAYTTVARAIVVHDEHDKPLTPRYLDVVEHGLPPSRGKGTKRVLAAR
ncbi:Flavin-binding oxidoreductase OS=Streptomyces glaucescens OX=1907 GN=SGLAU_30855 PE=4 SV=1 [Streptomyces glaucescens]